MHEQSLVKDLVGQVERASRGAIVTSVRVRLGKLCPLSPEHLRDHFAAAAAESETVGGAELVVVMVNDVADPLAGDLVLESIDVVEAV